MFAVCVGYAIVYIGAVQRSKHIQVNNNEMTSPKELFYHAMFMGEFEKARILLQELRGSSKKKAIQYLARIQAKR